MREILFRGKRISNGEWFEGMMTAQGERVAQIGTFIDYGTHVCIGSSYAVIPETVGQYTGLTDKNGKKVFEGDILKGSWDTVLIIFYDEISTSYRVKTSTGYEREPSYYGIDKWEVIGNIHDNPELLKGE